MKLTTKQQILYDHLALNPNDWHSPTQIGRDLLWGFYYYDSCRGNKQFDGSSSKVCQIMKKLLGYGLVERNKKGHYRIKEQK